MTRLADLKAAATLEPDPAPRAKPRVDPAPRAEPRAGPAPRAKPRSRTEPRAEPRVDPEPQTEPRVDPEPLDKVRLDRPMVAGFLVIALFFGGLGGWSAVAPLDSAAIAPGIVAVDTNRKTIQHFEGGIVADILVRDGDLVEDGQVLVVLDQTQAKSSLNLVRDRFRAASALEARLIAERDGLEAVVFPERLLAEKASAGVSEAISGQERIFAERRNGIAGQTGILEQRVAQFEEEINGLRGQIAAEKTQAGLIGEELKDMKALLAKQLVPKSQVLELERRAAEIQGSRSLNLAQIARAQQSIGESRLRIEELQTQMRNEAAAELRDVQTELFELEERIKSARDIAERTEIRAPIKGLVVDLQVHTAGGVVRPGDALLDIVPTGDSLVVSAKVSPDDIDVVHTGLPAQVRLTAFSARYYVPVEGQVTAVSADHLIDEISGEPYFSARVTLDDSSLKSALDGQALYPGMLAEVMIVTGERTMLDYLLQPLLQSFNRALRED